MRSWRETYTRRRPTDAEIADWEGWWPRANAAVITGAISGLVVVDIDGVRGRQSIADRNHWWKTLCVKTPNGFHLYFQYPDGHEIGNRAGTLPDMPNVDIRGTGGYVVGAGSLHPSGSHYRFFHEQEIAPLPDDLLSLLLHSTLPQVEEAAKPIYAPSRYAQAALDRERSMVARSHKSARNSTLNRAAYKLGQLVGGNYLDELHVVHALTDAAAKCGLTAKETQKTIISGLQAGKKCPRHL